MQCPEWVNDARRFVEAEFGVMSRGESACSRNVIGMGIDDEAKMEMPLSHDVFVLISEQSGVDDCRVTCLAACDEIRGASATFVEELLEIHRVSSLARCRCSGVSNEAYTRGGWC